MQPEQAIIQLLHRQDEQALTLIYRQYGRALLGVIHRIIPDPDLAEDVLQESLVKIWQNAASYDPAKGRLFTWLLNICRNLAIDKTRSRALKNIRNTTTFVSTEESDPLTVFNPDAIGVREWVSELEPKFRDVIDKVYLGEYTHQEAAEALGIPLGTLKTRVRLAIVELRKRL
ncbi:MAG: sigma-70 family RNA polymerase sigma factor [Bacteroidia bacterium]|nr:sigma-70 family RNA polymerase sigma factor [Bacteroidia bacterium]